MGENTNYDNEAASDESKTCRYISYYVEEKNGTTRHGKIYLPIFCFWQDFSSYLPIYIYIYIFFFKDLFTYIERVGINSIFVMANWQYIFYYNLDN